MAYFAQLDQANFVMRVLAVDNSSIDNLPFPESEPVGQAYLRDLYGAETIWAQTSYNASFRYNYTGIGDTFDPTAQPNGAFIAPCPGPDYVLDTTTYRWVKLPPTDNPPPVVL
jgi:hypothetical protein